MKYFALFCFVFWSWLCVLLFTTTPTDAYQSSFFTLDDFRHVVFAPSRFDAYSDNSFPAIVDAMYDLQRNKTSDWDLLKKQVYVATYMVQSAANTLTGLGL